jgi:hypothetical protein
MGEAIAESYEVSNGEARRERPGGRQILAARF